VEGKLPSKVLTSEKDEIYALKTVFMAQKKAKTPIAY
jgi:hypothetical protein